jgi:dihydroneopterin aldolase
MTDRIVLSNMVFQGRHGVGDGERAQVQPFEVDVEIHLDLRPAGLADDLSKTVDYRDVFEICRSIVEAPSRQLIETLAESIAEAVLQRSAAAGATQIVVRVRKPKAPLPGRLDHAAVEVTRRRKR